MWRETFSYLKQFNQIYKEMDIVYHEYAKRCGLSDMAYWILYSMAESDRCFTQRDFCREWFCAPQTVNSALKDLEKKHIIYLESVPGNKKNKWIKPTADGKRFMESTILPLLQNECDSFDALSPEERAAMLFATQKYVAALKSKNEETLVSVLSK